jgi:NADPH2:quinone reductase
MNTAMTEGKTVRAIVIDQPGPPETLQIGQIKYPELQPDSLLVDVHAAGVNFADILERDGTYPVSFPFVPGREGVGVVRETGTAVSEFTVGDRVAWTTVGASYAEQVIVPEAAAVAVPGALTDEQALSLAQGLTAHYLATSAYPAAVGDSVLVHAAAGGVGSLLTQILAIRGVRVLATVSTLQKAEIARAAGAADVLVLGEMADADLIQEVRRLTDGRGVSAVYDGVGQATFQASLGCLCRRGYLVLFGGSSGAVTAVDPAQLLSAGSVFLTRPGLADYIATREELVRRAAELYGWIAAGQLSVHIGGRYPLAEASRAHAELASRRSTGKLVLLTAHAHSGLD